MHIINILDLKTNNTLFLSDVYVFLLVKCTVQLRQCVEYNGTMWYWIEGVIWKPLICRLG